MIKQNVYQISWICQHKSGLRRDVMRFQRVYAKHFNVKKQIKSVFATICNTYCTIHCKIQMIFLINLKKLQCWVMAEWIKT